jgi:tetratricopeptide (TPR) repeat protein
VTRAGADQPPELRRLRATLAGRRAAGDPEGVIRAAGGAPPGSLTDPACARDVAWAHLAEKRAGRAWAILSAALSAHPGDRALAWDAGELALAMGKWPEAERIFQPLVPDPTDPAASPALTRLVRAWSPLGRHESAVTLLQRLAGRARPSGELVAAFEACVESAAAAGKGELSLAGFAALAACVPEDTTVALRAAELHLEAGGAEAALAWIRRVLSRHPGHVLARLLARRAAAMRRAQRTAELRLLLDGAEAGDRIVFTHEGRTLAPPPSEAYREANAHRGDLDPGELLVALARHLVEAGAADEALRALQRIQHADPDLAVEASALKARAWFHRGFPDLALEELARHPVRALARGPLMPALLLRARLSERAGRLAAALEAVRAARAAFERERARRRHDGASTPVGPASPADPADPTDPAAGIDPRALADWEARLSERLRTVVESGDAAPGRSERPSGRHPHPASAPAARPEGGRPPPAGASGPLPVWCPPGYEVLGEMGTGGMGRVFRARNLRLDRVEALKLLGETESGDPAARARFAGEARSLAQVAHPCVVRVFGSGAHAGRPYLTMELLAGETLGAALRRRGRLPIEEALAVAAALAAGLRAVHDGGIVHRDIKPDNVMLLAPSPGVKIMDFGLARDLGSSSGQRRESFMGTIHYIAPEQINGQELDRRTDVYSYGAVLYEMLTGQPPFDSDNPHSLMFLHLTRTPPSPRILRPEVPEALEQLVLECLEKAPARRPPDFGALLARLEQVMRTPSGR